MATDTEFYQKFKECGDEEDFNRTFTDYIKQHLFRKSNTQSTGETSTFFKNPLDMIKYLDKEMFGILENTDGDSDSDIQLLDGSDFILNFVKPKKKKLQFKNTKPLQTSDFLLDHAAKGFKEKVGFAKLEKTGRHRKSKSGRTRAPYPPDAGQRILDYVLENNLAISIGGNKTWMDMANDIELQSKMGKQRTWQSLESHFRKTVFPDLVKEDGPEMFQISDSDLKQFMAGRNIAHKTKHIYKKLLN